jgi:hypothetical protein
MHVRAIANITARPTRTSAGAGAATRSTASATAPEPPHVTPAPLRPAFEFEPNRADFKVIIFIYSRYCHLNNLKQNPSK